MSIFLFFIFIYLTTILNRCKISIFILFQSLRDGFKLSQKNTENLQRIKTNLNN